MATAPSSSLSSIAQDRKNRLAQLRSRKRKKSDSVEEQNDGASAKEKSTADDVPVRSGFLSGRNYNVETQAPKLGQEHRPTDGQKTLEAQAERLALETKEMADEEEQVNKPLDLFKLQPKKPNWDLKRDLDRKLEILNVRTDNAIARMVKERIQKQQEEAKKKGQTGGDGEIVGMEGNVLVEAMHLKEKEEEEERKAELRDEAEDSEGD